MNNFKKNSNIKSKKNKKCPQCGKFFTREDLIIHKKREHERERTTKDEDDLLPKNLDYNPHVANYVRGHGFRFNDKK